MDMQQSGFDKNKGLKTSFFFILSFLVLIGLASATDIDSCAELEGMSIGGDYVLTADINCSGYGDFDPIGGESTPFTGTFDGSGYTITGLTEDLGVGECGGLFATTNGAVLTNVSLVDVDITGGSYLGSLGGEIWDSNVSFIHVSGLVNGESNLGGMAGRAGGTSTISNCSADCNVTGTKGHLGGLIGRMDADHTILIGLYDSYATGDVSGTNSGVDNGIGGLIGKYTMGTVSNCYAAGDVTGNSSGYSPNDIGGLIGTMGLGSSSGQQSIIINRSFSTGFVDCDGYDCGGLVGNLTNGWIIDSYWVDHVGDDPTDCYYGGNENCTAKTSASWFYDYSNDPISYWDFPPWSTTYEDYSYPILADEGPICNSLDPPSPYACTNVNVTYAGDATIGVAATYENSEIHAHSITIRSGGNVTYDNVTLYVDSFTAEAGGQARFVNGTHTIWINGDVTVAGTLTWENETVRMNCSDDDDYSIIVQAAGDLNIINTTVTNGETSNAGYHFEVAGDLIIADSDIQKLTSTALDLNAGGSLTIGDTNFTQPDSSGSWSVDAGADVSLTGNISTELTLFKVSADGVTIDGNGYGIIGDSISDDYGMYVQGRVGVTIIDFGSVSHFASGVYLSSTSGSTIENVSISDNSNDGIIIQSSSGNTIENNSITACVRNGITFSGTSTGNIIFNTDIYANTNKQIDDTASGTNYLIYNNSEGEIKWTNALFLTDIDVSASDNLIFGQTVNISHNLVAVSDAFVTTGLKSEANVTLYNSPSSGMSNPVIARNIYSLCNDLTSPACTLHSSLSAATVEFDVSAWSNYSISDANLSAIKINQTVYLASQGGVVTFLLNITNVGNVTLGDIVLLDELPDGVTYSGANVTPSAIAGANVTWNLGSIDKDDSFLIILNVTVDNYPDECDSLTNDITVSAVLNSTANVSFIDSETFEVCEANVTSVKADITAYTASQGGIVEYNITVTNNGNVTLRTVIINDTIPSILTYNSSSLAPSASAAQYVTWTLTDLASGASQTIYMNATVDYYPDECDEVTNILNVTGIPYNGDNVTNNTWVNVTVCEANISVLKIDQTFAIASQGGLVTYNLTITNNGNVTLDPVRVVDTLPSQLEYTATNMTPNSTTGDVVIWENISSLAPGESVKITLNATVKSLSGMGCINISNNLTAEGVPPNGDNVSHTDLLDVEVCEAGIEVTKTVNHASIYTGNSAVFAITVQNNGFVNLSNVTLTDVLPSGLTYQSTNVTPNSTAPYVWYIGNLSVGSAAVKISITVKGPSRGTFTNYVNATASVPNGDNVSDEATRSLTVKKRSSGGGSGGSSGSMIIYNPTLPSEICGNGKCTGNETCMNCPEDCGECVVTIVVEKIPGLGEEIVIIVLGDDGIEVSEGIVFFTGPDGAVREVDIIGGIAKAVMDAPGVWTISYTDAAGNKVVETVAIARLSPEIKPDTTKDEAKDSYEPFVPTEYTSKEQTSSEDNTLLIVAVIVVIVAVIAALAFFMKPKKKGVLGSFLPKKVKKTGLRSL